MFVYLNNAMLSLISMYVIYYYSGSNFFYKMVHLLCRKSSKKIAAFVNIRLNIMRYVQ